MSKTPDTLTVQTMTEADWAMFLERIDDESCTPFVGGGLRIGGPDVYDVARTWAAEFGYPSRSYLDLPRVGPYVSVERDVMRPKELIARAFGFRTGAPGTPDFSLPETENDPHRVLAELPFPIYITTNYDDLMWRALRSRRDKEPRKELCRWNDDLQLQGSPSFEEGARPASPANPIVFHLYGHTESRESLVVTDDDYLQFLINVSRDQSAKSDRDRMIPSRIERAMNGASLLLLGYRLDDWDFRVLFHLLLSYRQSSTRTHVAVQLAPTDEPKEEQKEKLEKQLEVYQSYITKYFQSKNLKIHVSLQTCQDFVIELRDRWRRSPYGRRSHPPIIE